jgi:Flp pilus assembly protein TadG
MGNSAIASIYAAIAAYEPTVSTDQMPSVQGYGSVDSPLYSDMLPVRKLQAFANESEGEMAFVALGHTIQVTWTIQDRFYFRFANQGAGWQDFADELTTYSASYINILRTNRAPTTQSHITGARFVPSVFTLNDKRVAGVDVILTVQEVIS